MTLLDHYLNYATVNESPTIYHLWSGLSMISHAIGRRVWTDMEKFKVYPNMYVFLVGEAGIAKTTAMMDAYEVIANNLPTISLAPASITKESIVKTMADEQGGCVIKFQHDGKTLQFSQMSVFADELVILLNAGGNLPGMIDFLTGMFGANEYRDKTKNKGDFTVKGPYLNILGCITTELMKKLVQDKFVTGGLARRCVFVSAHKNAKAVPWIRYDESQLESKRIVADRIKKLQFLHGAFTWTKGAEDYYVEWYNSNYDRIETTSSEALRSFLRTKPAYCQKVSMLLAMAEEPSSLEHSSLTFKRAVEYVTAVENGAPELFDSSGKNELVGLTDKVSLYLRSLNTAIHSKALASHFWNDLPNGDLSIVDKVLQHLFSIGRVQFIADPESKTKKVIWKQDTKN